MGSPLQTKVFMGRIWEKWEFPFKFLFKNKVFIGNKNGKTIKEMEYTWNISWDNH